MDELLPGLAAAPNVHPVFVHFPIALFWTSLLFWMIGLLTAKESCFAAGRWTLWLGIAFGAVAVLTGLSAEAGQRTKAVEEHVRFHKVMMLTTTGLAVLTAVLSIVFRKVQRTAARAVETLAMALCVAVMTIGADRGGYLVFGHGVGTQLHPQAPDGGQPVDASGTRGDRGPGEARDEQRGDGARK